MTLDYFISAFFVSVFITAFPVLAIRGIYKLFKSIK
jgi:hypothetical protein